MKTALIAAIVSAVVAASVATATTTVVITGAQIKDGSIQARDLSAKARRSLRGRRGTRGLPGPAYLNALRGRDVVVPPGGRAFASAMCPGSPRAVSGNFYAGGAKVLFASTTLGTEDQFHSVGVLNDTNAPVTIYAEVLCSRPRPW